MRKARALQWVAHLSCSGMKYTFKSRHDVGCRCLCDRILVLGHDLVSVEMEMSCCQVYCVSVVISCEADDVDGGHISNIDNASDADHGLRRAIAT